MKPSKQKTKWKGFFYTLAEILLQQSENLSDFYKVLFQFAICNMIVPLPKSQTYHPVCTQLLPSISHTVFRHDQSLQPPPCSFSCVYEVAQSPLKNMWEQIPEEFWWGFVITKDFVKICLMWEREGNTSADWLVNTFGIQVTVQSCCEKQFVNKLCKRR